MDILFFSHYFPPEVNAPASRTYANCRRWAASGHRVTVVTGAPNCPDGVLYPGYRNQLRQKEVMDGIEVVRVWTFIAANRGIFLRSLNYLSYLFSSLLAVLFRKRPDIIIATSPQLFCGLSGLLAGKIRRVPAILEVRDIWPESILAVEAINSPGVVGFLGWLERRMYRWALHIVAVGEGYRQKLLEKGVEPGKISVVTNGVDRDIFFPRPPDRELKEKLGLAGRLVCGYLGTIGMACGLESVLEAAEILKDRGRDDVVFLLVGSGAMRVRLEEQKHRRGLDNVVFTGQVGKSEIPRYLSICDLVLVHLKKVPLFTTVLPSKIFEAAGMARPIVCGVAGHAARLVRESGAGVEVEPGSPRELAEALIRLADDPAARRRLGENGLKNLAARFDRDRLADDYLKIMRDIRDTR